MLTRSVWLAVAANVPSEADRLGFAFTRVFPTTRVDRPAPTGGPAFMSCYREEGGNESGRIMLGGSIAPSVKMSDPFIHETAAPLEE